MNHDVRSVDLFSGELGFAKVDPLSWVARGPVKGTDVMGSQRSDRSGGCCPDESCCANNGEYGFGGGRLRVQDDGCLFALIR
jgi:hypothetical protein